MDFFYICPKLCWLAGVSFYGPCSTWRAGHLDQVILLVWPYCSILIILRKLPLKLFSNKLVNFQFLETPHFDKIQVIIYYLLVSRLK